MSLHWTLIAGFLYAEIAIVILFLLPFISTRFWSRVFKSKFLKGLESQLIYYFYVLITILILFFLDAIREMRKYGDDQRFDGENSHSHGEHLDVQMQTQNRLFRAQRNFYISGFSLFLSLVIRRLVSLVSANACLDVEREAAMKQAESATRAAEALMVKSSSQERGDNENKDAGYDESLKSQLKTTQEELSKARKDVESMKTQSENLAQEYDRLMEEKDKLALKVSVQGDKKDD